MLYFDFMKEKKMEQNVRGGWVGDWMGGWLAAWLNLCSLYFNYLKYCPFMFLFICIKNPLLNCFGTSILNNSIGNHFWDGMDRCMDPIKNTINLKFTGSMSQVYCWQSCIEAYKKKIVFYCWGNCFYDGWMGGLVSRSAKMKDDYLAHLVG